MWPKLTVGKLTLMTHALIVVMAQSRLTHKAHLHLKYNIELSLLLIFTQIIDFQKDLFSLFLLAKNWKQLRFHPVSELVNKLPCLWD